MTTSETPSTAEVAVKLDALTDLELAHFHLGINRGYGRSRDYCKARPWFPIVADLFDEGGQRQEVHESVRDAVDTIVLVRLSA